MLNISNEAYFVLAGVVALGVGWLLGCGISWLLRLLTEIMNSVAHALECTIVLQARMDEVERRQRNG